MPAFSSFGNGLSEGLNSGSGLANAMYTAPIQRRLMMAQASKAEQESDPNGPMGQMERARAQNYTREAARPLPSMVDMGDITGNPRLKGIRVEGAQALPYVIGNASKTGGVGGATGNNGFIQLDNEGKKTIQDVAMEMGGLKNAYDLGNKGGVFGMSPSNFIGDSVMQSGMTKIPGLGVVLQNANTAGQQYKTAAQDAMFRVAKVLSGSRPAFQLQQEMEAQAPRQGAKDPIGQYNAVMNSGESRLQGLIDDYAMNHSPEMTNEFKRQLTETFGKFRIGNTGGGVTTNQEGSGLSAGKYATHTGETLEQLEARRNGGR